MTWTYTSTDLSTDLMKIRRWIGDVDTTDQFLTDEEVNSASSQSGSNEGAAAMCCEWIAAGFARKADKTVGPLHIALQQKYEHYIELASRFRANLSVYALPSAGGIDVDDVDDMVSDTNRVEPSFRVGMMDHPDVTTSSTST